MKDGRGVHETKSMWHMERQNNVSGREAKGRAGMWRRQECRSRASPSIAASML
jgi:hypothetical protein